MRVLFAVAVVAALASSASAQPGLTPPSIYGPPVQLQLTSDDAKLLARGEISDDRQIGGGVASILVGFGLGQAIEGRWGDTGWIFTFGEGGSFALFFVGLMNTLACDFGQPKVGGVPQRSCNSDGWASATMIGMIGTAGFHIGGIVDAFAGPSGHNARVRALRARLGASRIGVSPFVAPTRAGDGGVAGVALRF